MSDSKVSCGLDIGSNTFSFVELCRESNRTRIVNDMSLGVRLSEGLLDESPLNLRAVERGLRALEELVERFDIKGKLLRTVGTAVLRRTSTPEVFTDPAFEILGCPVEIISGKEEAQLTAQGAIIGVQGDGPWIILDIGGQSTEVCWYTYDADFQSISLSMGVVQLTEVFVHSDPPRVEELEAMRAYIRKTLSENIPRQLPGQVMCVAGTATSLASLELGLKEWKRERVHGKIMDRDRLGEWSDILSAIPALDRTQTYGVRPIRADVFPAGIAVLEELLDYLCRSSFTVSANGLRVGVALSIL